MFWFSGILGCMISLLHLHIHESQVASVMVAAAAEHMKFILKCSDFGWECDFHSGG